MNQSLEDYIAYGVKAMQERKYALADTLNKTTNPLEKLAMQDKIAEIDVCISYFKEHVNFKSRAEMLVSEPEVPATANTKK